MSILSPSPHSEKASAGSDSPWVTAGTRSRVSSRTRPGFQHSSPDSVVLQGKSSSEVKGHRGRARRDKPASMPEETPEKAQVRLRGWNAAVRPRTTHSGPSEILIGLYDDSEGMRVACMLLQSRPAAGFGVLRQRDTYTGAGHPVAPCLMPPSHSCACLCRMLRAPSKRRMRRAGSYSRPTTSVCIV